MGALQAPVATARAPVARPAQMPYRETAARPAPLVTSLRANGNTSTLSDAQLETAGVEGLFQVLQSGNEQDQLRSLQALSERRPDMFRAMMRRMNMSVQDAEELVGTRSARNARAK